MQFYRQNCGLFVKIHQVNGKVMLSVKMFGIRKNVNLNVSMTKAGNWKGADKTSYRVDIEQVKTIFILCRRSSKRKTLKM